MTIKKLKSIDIINVLSDLVSEKLETTVKLPGKVKMNGKDVYPYANAYFFQIASMIGNDIILGLDAHSPDQLSYEMYHYLEKLAEEYHLHVLNHIEFKKGKQ